MTEENKTGDDGDDLTGEDGDSTSEPGSTKGNGHATGSAKGDSNASRPDVGTDLWRLLGTMVGVLVAFALGMWVMNFMGKTHASDGSTLLMASTQVQRGVITVSVALGTTIIAVAISLAALFGFARSEDIGQAREVLALLIGVLGAVLGFYFGEAGEDAQELAPPPAAVEGSGTVPTRTEEAPFDEVEVPEGPSDTGDQARDPEGSGAFEKVSADG